MTASPHLTGFIAACFVVSIGGKVIKHAESFKAGKARLSFLVPKSAKGKLLKVKVTIKAGTKSTTRIATFRVH